MQVEIVKILRKDKEFKELEILFSWAQFYQNSEQLAVSRYPRCYYYDNKFRKKVVLVSEKDTGMIMYIPDGDQKRYNEIQEKIKSVGNR